MQYKRINFRQQIQFKCNCSRASLATFDDQTNLTILNAFT
jgi:hypothetical protein